MALNNGGTMKKYLFGLGAMLVGAGLMFVFCVDAWMEWGSKCG